MNNFNTLLNPSLITGTSAAVSGNVRSGNVGNSITPTAQNSGAFENIIQNQIQPSNKTLISGDITLLTDALDISPEELSVAVSQLTQQPINNLDQLRNALIQAPEGLITPSSLTAALNIVKQENPALLSGNILPNALQENNSTQATNTLLQETAIPQKLATEATLATSVQASLSKAGEQRLDNSTIHKASNAQNLTSTVTNASNAQHSVNLPISQLPQPDTSGRLVPTIDPYADQSVKQIAAKIVNNSPFSQALQPTTGNTNALTPQATKIGTQPQDVTHTQTNLLVQTATKTSADINNSAVQLSTTSSKAHTISHSGTELHNTTPSTQNSAQAFSSLQAPSLETLNHSNAQFVENQRLLQGNISSVDTNADTIITQNKATNEQIALANSETQKAELIQTRSAESRPYTSAAEQVSLKVSKALSTGDSNIEVQLDPAKLGKVSVNIAIQKNGQISIVMMAERSETLEMLRADSKSLERALADSGLSTGQNSLNFGLKDQQHNPFEQFHNTYANLTSQEEELAIDTLSASHLSGQIMMSDRALDIHA